MLYPESYREQLKHVTFRHDMRFTVEKITALWKMDQRRLD